MTSNKFRSAAAKRIGDRLVIDWGVVDLEQFRIGLAIEMEHGLRDPRTNVIGNDDLLRGKIAWAQLAEFPDYYTRPHCGTTASLARKSLRKMEKPGSSGR